MAGIIFVLRSGILWEMLPGELGCSGMTCWRRLRDWHEAGVWAGLHRVLLERLLDAGHLDWSRASLDSAFVAAKRGVPRPARTRRIAGRTGRRQRHLVVGRKGTPLRVRLSPANRHDSLMLASTLDAVPGARRGRGCGRPRRPDKLHADKAHDHRRCRKECHARSIAPRIARRSMETSERLGRHRWVVERTLAWLARFHRLHSAHERRADIHKAFVLLGRAPICLNQIKRLY